jgi:3-methyladenine DNA glycosylase/8-oxoguanine DNA glycosylase
MSGPLDVPRATAHLRRADPVLDRVIRCVGPCRLRVERRGAHFAALVEAIVYQQITGAAAATIHARLCGLVGDRRPRPQDFTSLPDRALRGAGLSRQKVAYLRDLVRHVGNGLPIRTLGRLPDEAVVEALTKVKGIGRWTAEMFLMFRLGRPDVLPVDDYGIRKAMQRVYRMRALPGPERMRTVAEPWRPYRSVACWYLWRALES